MTANEIEDVIKKAWDVGIEVIWAKMEDDVGREGVHLIEPTFEDVVGGLTSALHYGCSLVVIHSKVVRRFAGQRNLHLLKKSSKR